MRTPYRQRGLGWFGLLFVLGVIALAATVVIKCMPLYMNQMKLARAVQAVAADPEMGQADPVTIRSRLQRRWDIEDIVLIEPKDIKIKRSERGRELVYDYEARTRLFYNIYIVIHFQDELQMRHTEG